jgi:hypothetical protein
LLVKKFHDIKGRLDGFDGCPRIAAVVGSAVISGSSFAVNIFFVHDLKFEDGPVKNPAMREQLTGGESIAVHLYVPPLPE